MVKRKLSQAKVNGKRPAQSDGNAKKRKLPKSKQPQYEMAKPLPEGTILEDLFRKQWRLGKPFAAGGFGLLYLASLSSDTKKTDKYVIKLEPHSNGPLFCEMHFYQRVCKPEKIAKWLSSTKLKKLGIPTNVSFGYHEPSADRKYRFMVMPRYGSDVEKLFDSNSRRFSVRSVFSIGLKVLNCLEYIHENEYVHADIKGSNLLLGCDTIDDLYLVDYGLAFRYTTDGEHRKYRADPTRTHDGTIEYTSRDAHLGAMPSRRGDLEILGYCMLQWLCGRLPWEDRLNNKNWVRDQKIKYMKDIKSLMRVCFPDGDEPAEFANYLLYVDSLGYTQRPDYAHVRTLFNAALIGIPLSPSASSGSSMVQGRLGSASAGSLVVRAAGGQRTPVRRRAADCETAKVTRTHPTSPNGNAVRPSSPPHRASSPRAAATVAHRSRPAVRSPSTDSSEVTSPRKTKPRRVASGVDATTRSLRINRKRTARSSAVDSESSGDRVTTAKAKLATKLKSRKLATKAAPSVNVACQTTPGLRVRRRRMKN